MFDNPMSLWLLLTMLPLAAFVLYSWRKYCVFENSQQGKIFTRTGSLPTWFSRLLIVGSLFLGLILICFGLAEPYVMIKTSDVQYKNVRIIFLLDVSGSMVFAEDIKPNRLSAAKSQIVKLHEKIGDKYAFGLIPFAGEANRYYCPIAKSVLFLPLLSRTGPEVVSSAGTDLTAAMEAVLDNIKEDGFEKEGVNIVILLSDGGKEEAEATDRAKLMKIVKELSSKNSRIYSVGVGLLEKTPLLKRNANGVFEDFIRDEFNNVCYSQIDETILRNIADEGKGKYLNFEQGNQLEDFVIGVIEENRLEDASVVSYKKLTIQSYMFAAAVIFIWAAFTRNNR